MENENNAREFLDLYNTLEELLNAKYTGRDGKFSSAVVRFINEPEGRGWREELNICRDLRNFLSHHSLIDGNEIIQPSNDIIELLYAIVESVKNPPIAMNIAVKTENIFTCSMNDDAYEIAGKMDKRGFSHVPILDDNKIKGVFSSGTVFSYLCRFGADKIKKNMKISDYGNLLNLEEHTTEQYEFVSKRMSYFDLKRCFEKKNNNPKRVAVAFVTENGVKNETLLGMITPWDVIRSYPEFS